MNGQTNVVKFGLSKKCGFLRVCLFDMYLEGLKNSLHGDKEDTA